MICFFLFIIITGDIMKKFLIILFSLFIVSVKSNRLSDDSYSLRTLTFSNLSTNNIYDFFSDVRIIKIYPYINPIYKDRVGEIVFEVNDSLVNSIERLKSKYFNLIKKNSYSDYNYFYLNGINIYKMDVYISNNDLFNILSDNRLLVDSIKQVLWYTYNGGSSVYNKLREIRMKNKMTAREVSEKVGISKPFYCQLENCKRRLSYDTAIKIASVFDVKPDYLFYEETLDRIKNVK